MARFVNAADLIRRDLRLIDFHGNLIDHIEINNRRLFYKHKLYRLLDGQTIGKTIFIGHNNFDHIVPTLQAAWELGANVFVHDFHVGYTTIPEFQGFYDFVDVVIHDHVVREAFANKLSFSTLDYQQSVRYPDIIWQIVGPGLGPDTVAVKTHSSGTTGMPKIIDFTHGMVHDLVQRLITMFDFRPEDRAFHWKTLHHASLFLNYAVPLLHVSSTHFYGRSNILEGLPYSGASFAQRVLPYAYQFGITRMLVPYDWLQEFDQAPLMDLQHRLSLHCIRGTSTDKVHWVMENLRPREILDIFGCSEIGVMFVGRITPENYQQFQPGVFTEIMPDLEYRFNVTSVDVRWAGGDWQTLEDVFETLPQGVRFRHRNYKIWRGKRAVDIAPLDNYLKQRYNTSQFQVVGDFRDNLLYLAVFDHSIPVDLAAVNQDIADNLSPWHQLQAIQRFDLPDVLSGMKPSRPILLYAMKQQESTDASTPN